MTSGAYSVAIIRDAVDISQLANAVSLSIPDCTGLAASFSVCLTVGNEANAVIAIEGEGRLTGEAVIIAIIRTASQNNALSDTA